MKNPYILTSFFLLTCIYIFLCSVYKVFLLSFIFITIHESTHCITAYFLGYKANKIKLLPFGITINLKNEFIKPLDDILISFSGPLINFIFFIIFSLFSSNHNDLLNKLKNINLLLGTINLLPISYLDGGRILKNIIKLYFSIYYSYIILYLTSIILSGIIILVGITKPGVLTPLYLAIGVFTIYLTLESRKLIIIDILKDILYKRTYLKNKNKVKLILKAYSNKNKILDIIKYFCFNNYHVIYIMEAGKIVNKIDEIDLISLYCSYGNLTLTDDKLNSFKVNP